MQAMKPTNLGILLVSASLATTALAGSDAPPSSKAKKAAMNMTASCDPAREAYVAIAKSAGEQGTTRIKFQVSEQGAVQRSEVARTSGSKGLDVTALNALSRCSFSPEIGADGKPTSVSQEIEYVWKLNKKAVAS